MIIETPMSKYTCATAEERSDGVHLLRDDGSTIVIIANKSGIKSVDGGEITVAEELQAGLEIADLKAKLTATDYQAIKYAEGLITEGDYAPMKAQRQAWRDRINELEKEVSV